MTFPSFVIHGIGLSFCLVSSLKSCIVYLVLAVLHAVHVHTVCFTKKFSTITTVNWPASCSELIQLHTSVPTAHALEKKDHMPKL